MARIIVTGAKGQLGHCLLDRALHFSEHRVLGYDIDDLDILDSHTLYQVAKKEATDVLINCAAYTAVDRAEQEREKAWRVNSEAVMGLADVCSRLQALLIHLSTDYVFDGLSSIPYTEDDLPNPLSVYGASKLSGERFALLYGRSVVVRTSWLFSPYGNNFVNTLLRIGSEKDALNVVNDQIGSPTYAPHLAKVLLQMVEQIEGSTSPESLMGLYHFSNSGSCSRFAFAQKIKELSGLKVSLLPVASSECPAPAKRPAYSVFDTQKITTIFGMSPPSWEDGLRDYFTST